MVSVINYRGYTMVVKQKGIEDESFYHFIKSLNNFSMENRVKATQTHNVGGKWYAILYYEEK